MLRKVMLGAVLLVALAASPAYGQYPTVVVNPGQVSAGGAVTVTGNGCVPNAPIAVTVTSADGGSPVATANTTSDGNGEFSVSVTIPAGTAVGSYVVAASNCSDTTSLEVVGTSTTPTTSPGNAPGGNAPGGTGSVGSGTLPRTGSNISQLGLIGVGLLTVGGLVLVATKRRRQPRHQTA